MILESANTFFSQKNSDNLYIDTVLSTMNIQKSVLSDNTTNKYTSEYVKNVLEKIDYDSAIPTFRDDLDARLIDALGNISNPQKMIFVDINNDSDSYIERTFEIRINNSSASSDVVNFKILDYQHLDNGFTGAIIQNTKTDEVILWADGTKGINLENIKNSPVEIAIDWMNNILGIGRGEIFPQLESLKEFAENYNRNCIIKKQPPITIGIGQSMMAIGMSALAFTEGFENIQFRTYSGCVTEDLLSSIKNKWGLNNLDGANLETYITPNEPLFNLLKPHIGQNSFYIKGLTHKTGIAVHGAEAYFNNNQQNSEYYKIISFNIDKNRLWKAEPILDFGVSKVGTGIGGFAKISFFSIFSNKKEMIKTAEDIEDLLEEAGVTKEYTIVEYNNEFYRETYIDYELSTSAEIVNLNPNLQDVYNDEEDKFYIKCNENGEFIENIKIPTKTYNYLEKPVMSLPMFFDNATISEPQGGDPILLDLNGDGIKTVSVENGINLDHQSDGFAERSAWVSDEDGILFIDKNNNGVIDNGSELFGENYVKSDGSNATTGFDALADLDSNNDGVIDSSDTQFSNLKVQKGVCLLEKQEYHQ